MDNKVTLELSKDEALVLFAFLTRFNETDNESFFEDQAEQRVFWDIECLLEKTLVEPFQNNYEDSLKQARDKIRDAK